MGFSRHCFPNAGNVRPRERLTGCFKKRDCYENKESMKYFPAKCLVKTKQELSFPKLSAANHSPPPLRYVINTLSTLLFSPCRTLSHLQTEWCFCSEVSLISPMLVAPTSLVPMGSAYFSLYIYHNTLMLLFIHLW